MWNGFVEKNHFLREWLRQLPHINPDTTPSEILCINPKNSPFHKKGWVLLVRSTFHVKDNQKSSLFKL